MFDPGYRTDRLRRFRLSDHQMIHAVLKLVPGSLEYVDYAPDLPDDLTIERIIPCPHRYPPGFTVVVSHPSFSPVPDGEEIPLLPVFFRRDPNPTADPIDMTIHPIN